MFRHQLPDLVLLELALLLGRLVLKLLLPLQILWAIGNRGATVALRQRLKEQCLVRLSQDRQALSAAD